MANAPTPNRIDQTPVRMSTNLDVGRQTPKTDFGDRIKAGLDTTAGVVANGAAVIAPFVPGGAIVSAAVSSVGTTANSRSSGQAVTGQYAATGVVNLGGGAGGIGTVAGGGAGAGGVGTTLGGAPGVGTVGVPGTVAGNGISQLQTGGTDMVGSFNQQMLDAQAQNSQLIQLQIQMNQESQTFSTISNVLKVRNDAAKNSIQNIH
jgi:hypothetical protein